MSKILIIPDVHLKHWMFDIADSIMEENNIEIAVFLGDLVDEWHQDTNYLLYKETIDRAIKFKHDHPESLFCWGNHDLAYLVTDWSCSGHNNLYHHEIKHLISRYEYEVQPKYIHIIDKYIFSHAGITNSLVDKNDDINTIQSKINKISYSKIGDYNSPIWLRPKLSNIYFNKYTQFVAHTPIKQPLYFKDNNTWILDTYSVNPITNKPYGNEYMLVLDSNTENIQMYNKDKLVISIDKSHWTDFSDLNTLYAD